MPKGVPDPRPAVQRRLAELLGQKYEWMATSAKLRKLVKDPERLDRVLAILQKDFGVSIDRRLLRAVNTVKDLVNLVAGAAEAIAPDTLEKAPTSTLPPRQALPDQVQDSPAAGAAATVPALAPRIPRADTYDCPLTYEAERIHAVAVYCSDGRIGDHVDDFLHNGLGLPRYDRVACPGGPVALAGRLTSFWECRGVEEQLRFLVKAHGIERTILIAHQPCAYYAARLGIAPERLEGEQRRDLEQATWGVQRMAPELEVASFMAWIDGTTVRFEKLSTTAGIEQHVSRWRGRAQT
jgi:hypothetical protein